MDWSSDVCASDRSAYDRRVAVLTMGALMISGLVSLAVAGDYIYFGVMRDTLGVGDTLLIAPVAGLGGGLAGGLFARIVLAASDRTANWARRVATRPILFAAGRSEEHTSELQSLMRISYAFFCLKKKNN